jgi:hypothetical protein
MTLSEWTEKYHNQAKKQGWSLFNQEGDIMILKIDDVDEGDAELPGDDEALKLVKSQAYTGCEMSIQALKMDEKPVWKNFRDREEISY